MNTTFWKLALVDCHHNVGTVTSASYEPQLCAAFDASSCIEGDEAGARAVGYKEHEAEAFVTFLQSWLSGRSAP